MNICVNCQSWLKEAYAQSQTHIHSKEPTVYGCITVFLHCTDLIFTFLLYWDCITAVRNSISLTKNMENIVKCFIWALCNIHLFSHFISFKCTICNFSGSGLPVHLMWFGTEMFESFVHVPFAHLPTSWLTD